jgi:hypothetical protein
MHIPQLVADRILANRRHFHDLNAKAQQRQREQAGRNSEFLLQMEKITGQPIEVVSYGFQTKPLTLDRERQFWTMEDDEELEEFLFGDLLSALWGEVPPSHDELTNSQWRALPPGYRPLVLVLEFERHSQFEGWAAVENRADDLQEIIAAYRYMGLHDEAAALTAAIEALARTSGDDEDAFHDALASAYRSVPNATPEYEDRVPRILAFVRAHPELFSAKD